MRTIAILSSLFLATAAAHGQQQFQGVCSNVKIEIQQELTTERIGFEATLKVTNNDGADPITEFSAELTFEDPETGEDAADRFFVQPPTFESINRIDGTGVIGPTKQAIVRWFIIPKIETGGEDPRGKEYKVGCVLAGNMRGTPLPEETLLVIPDTINVKPESRLRITYFQPRDVQGDDPFTEEVESPVPFTLGVLVKNVGYGPAKAVKIDSKQPKIVENKNGLLLIARLLGARVQDSPLDETSLLVNLGDIPPGETRKGAWDMITSLSGEFVEFKASYTHADELGGEETSIIESLEAHFIAAEVLNDEPGRDDVLDFLADVDRDANRIPDTLFESNGNELPVNQLLDVEVEGGIPAGDVRVVADSDREGWVYMRLDDPGSAKYDIVSVTRDDGKVLNEHNVWTNVRYRPSDNQRLAFLNIFDRVETGRIYTYDVEYAPPAEDNTPPDTRIRFAGEASQAGNTYYINAETQVYFTSEDESLVSIYYKVDGGEFLPALPFTLDQPGTYTITYYAEDSSGNVEAEQAATVVIQTEGGDAGGVTVAVDEDRIFPADVLSVRPSHTTLSFTVPENALQIDGNVDIFRGILSAPVVAGVPPSPTSADSASLTVGGQFVDFYRYRVNGGAWSGDVPVDQPIVLTGLSGVQSVEILGRHELGAYPPAGQATVVGWMVDPAAPAFALEGLPASPSLTARDLTLQVSEPSATRYKWKLDDRFFLEVGIDDPIEIDDLTPGPHTISLIAEIDGTFQDEEDASVVNFIYDPAYGFNYAGLTQVRSEAYTDIAGLTTDFAWDGRDDNGIGLIPGVYTARVTVTDPLGNNSYAAQVIVIEGISTRQTTIAESSAGGKQLRAWGNWAVWQQNPGGVWNILAQDLTTEDPPVEITSGDERDQENPATDGNYVVWQTRLDNGATDIFTADLSDPQNHVQVTDSRDSIEVNPVVEWPWIAYQTKSASNPDAPWQVEAINMITDESFLVSAGVGDQFRPRIHGGRVVWEDHRDVGPGEVYFGDLETGLVRRITNNTFGQNNPTIYGHWIAWQDNRDGQVDIFAYDLRKGTEWQVTDTDYNEVSPFLADNWLLYEEDSLGPDSANLRLADIQTGASLFVTRAEASHTYGALGNGFAVWIETDADRKVVSSFLPGFQPVMGHANALAVTDRLTERFDSAFDLLEQWGAEAGVSTVSYFSSLSPVESQVAMLADAVPQGDDFALVPGSFLWVEFGEADIVDLGSGNDNPVDLSAGVSALTYTAFPINFTAYGLVDSIGTANLNSLRFFDAFNGVWRAVEVDGSGELIGADFVIPRVAVVLLDLANPVSGWNP